MKKRDFLETTFFPKSTKSLMRLASNFLSLGCGRECNQVSPRLTRTIFTLTILRYTIFYQSPPRKFQLTPMRYHVAINIALQIGGNRNIVVI